MKSKLTAICTLLLSVLISMATFSACGEVMESLAEDGRQQIADEEAIARKQAELAVGSATSAPASSTATSSMASGAIETEEQAKQILMDWIVENEFSPGVEPILESNGIYEAASKSYYEFVLLVAGAPFQAGTFLVEQSNGELYLLDFITEEIVTLTQWFEGDSSSTSPQGSADSVYMGDFDTSVEFGGLEIIVPSNHAIGTHYDIDSSRSDFLFLFPLVTNNGSSPATLSQYDVGVFGPNGTEITPISDVFSNNVFYSPISSGRGDMLPGASQELIIVVPYSGPGDYTVHFSGILANASLTLPVSRDTAAPSRGIVGRWTLDLESSDGFYSLAKTDFLEFDEEGRGTLSINGTVLPFRWTIGMDSETSRLIIFTDNPKVSLSSFHEISGTSLYLPRSLETMMFPDSGLKQHEGADWFIKDQNYYN